MNNRKFFFVVLLFLGGWMDSGFADENEDIQNLANAFSDIAGVRVSAHWFLSYQSGQSRQNAYSLFGLKRGYITIRKKLTHFSARITPDISTDREGDGRGDLEMRLKYCYLKYELEGSAFFTRPSFEFGLVHRPWISFEESINTYRVQGTMFLERIGILNSADFGITFASLLGGELDTGAQRMPYDEHPGKWGSVAVGIYNGGGYHAIEENLNKTVEARLSLRPLGSMVPGLQLTFLGVRGKGNTPEAPDWALDTAFLSLETPSLTLTGTYFRGVGNYTGSAVDGTGMALEQAGHSLFGEARFRRGRLGIMARYDSFEHRGHPSSRQERMIAGAAYHLFPGSKIVFSYDRLLAGEEESNESRFEVAMEIHY